ncbi:hypothetical protein HDE_07100 [Halotydeus destructor]|nr:hypothetical protein HDE_07100 [Halotydeus destructor]
MAYDPLYPVHAAYPVAQEIWELHHMELTQQLVNVLGYRKSFKYLTKRFENLPSSHRGLALLTVLTFVATWLALVVTDNKQHWISSVSAVGGRIKRALVTVRHRLLGIRGLNSQ